jgi:DNA processing protein
VIDEKILDWVCLSNTAGIGSKTFWTLLNKYKTATEALNYVKNPFSKQKAKQILKSINYEILLANDKDFPIELKRSCSCPPMLFYKGDKSILSKRKIGIVGARNASIHGMKIARTLAEKLSSEFAIISGLAKGIDANAHVGSLECPENKSAIAVLPFSLENVYPKENKNIYEKIAKYGLLISEVFPYSVPEQGMFQGRNRLISLLAQGMIIIEAGVKSGTMSTAKIALDYGCEVMAVPGSPLDPRYFGSNLLIKNGAPLIQNYYDVIEVLGADNRVPSQPPIETKKIIEKQDNFEKYEKVLSVLSSTPVSIDLISKYVQIEIPELLRIISDLEILGKIIKYCANEIALA